MRPIVLTLALIFELLAFASGETVPDYAALIQQGKAQLQAEHTDQALATGEQAIKFDAKRWEGYALAGGALMNLKRYDEAITRLSDAIERAPQDKQASLIELRKQCFAAESGAAPIPAQSTPSPASPSGAESTATQAEIVLWKTIENSQQEGDFKVYLSQYPNGAFVTLAHQHLAKLEAAKTRQFSMYGNLPDSVWMGTAASPSETLTVLIIYLDNGRLAWQGFTDDKDSRSKLESIRSDITALSKGAFLSTYASHLNNTGTFALENGVVLKAKLSSSSSASMHCEMTLEGQLDRNAISGTSAFVGDSTREGRKCEKWSPYEWHLQRKFQ